MNESLNNEQLESKIDRYINGKLNASEVDELWAELIQEEEYLDYMKTTANLKAIIRRRQKKKTQQQRWYYAAAAIIVLLLAVISVMELSNWSVSNNVEPIAQIELDYYRSGDGSLTEEATQNIINDAIKLANTGEVEKAIALLEEELQNTSDPKWVAQLSLNLGTLFYNEAQYPSAIESYRQVIENREYVDVLMLEKAYWYAGNAYFHLDQLAEARNNIEKAYELDGAYRRVAESYLNALG